MVRSQSRQLFGTFWSLRHRYPDDRRLSLPLSIHQGRSRRLALWCEAQVSTWSRAPSRTDSLQHYLVVATTNQHQRLAHHARLAMSDAEQPLLDKEDLSSHPEHRMPLQRQTSWSLWHLLAAALGGALLSTVLHRCLPSPKVIPDRYLEADPEEVPSCPSTDALPVTAPRTSQSGSRLGIDCADTSVQISGRTSISARQSTFANGSWILNGV